MLGVMCQYKQDDRNMGKGAKRWVGPIDKLNDFWDDIIWQIWGAKDRLKWKVRADMSQKCGHV